MVILQRDYGGPGSVDVAARFHQTELTNQSTSFAEQEHQIIAVRSTIVREVQSISLVTENVRPGVYEVQKVQICDPLQSGAPLMFRLGLYNVYTGRPLFLIYGYKMFFYLCVTVCYKVNTCLTFSQ